jgi:hypothetical protein
MRVKIIQVCRVERHITIDVDAPDIESAVESVSSGEIDAPDFDDPRCESYWDLQNEEVTPAEG